MSEEKNESRKKPGKVRRIAGGLLIVLVAAFTVYLSAVMLHRIHTVVLKDNYRRIFSRELILCAVLLAAALDLRFGFLTRLPGKLLKALGWALRLMIVAAAILILVLCGKVAAGSMVRTEARAEHAIVLGMALEDGKPTKDLLLRLDTAQQYLERNPEAKLILTGGNPDKNGRTEAAAMRELLLERGVAGDRMILEDQAKTTKDNFRLAAQVIDPAAPVVLISSNYHMDRAVRTAHEAGFQQVLRLPAPSDPLYYGVNMFWEVMLDLNDMTHPAR